ALNGDLDPKSTEVWSHIALGRIFDITGQRERAVDEYQHALRTEDNTQGALGEAARRLKETLPASGTTTDPLPTLSEQPLAQGVYRAGNGLVPPQPIQRMEPEYTEEARLAELEGAVLLAGVIAVDGLAQD